ncbi:MAG: TrbG/VirB9 family P-type conjugative transfer protein [Hydrogenophaga sp.]|jgi:type IV secretion system protein VirB9|uniref:TrbG/VirB9 family P-type conjugative transfer protein n=1 Tax=Hydrogenophaga sp. TaxID=1904254 RepID=UPI00271D4DDC|nr:TrbG/VirB9 family P-type conjugative transfer protein [Hydrogenophaga sp.]MDO9479173.1 TrbG/VirB9 family P-type conjugative transfer protein [Hydrogenophaga sp.]MDP3808806.1 TrbG/VirB9 family P-type conjugative transfer protein [Hydrogenophaga sp.]MDP3922451.1 TrbG/VirB9 family P-type conjugative transfer protein [Hydrogenophaga sp.]
MNRPALSLALLTLALAHQPASAAQPTDKTDPRLREVVYDANAVVTVPVKRGMVTLVELDKGEVITEVAVGQGGDCSKPDAAWCVAAQPGGRHLYVKAKSAADAPNNLAIITDRRSHTLRFVVLSDSDRQTPIYRLAIRSPKPAAASPSLAEKELAALASLPPIPPPPTAQQIVTERLAAKPTVLNTQYALAEGTGSADIVPTLVYDDGRFTYLRFPGNREVPAVFHVLGDGSETLVNARMEDDTLVVDRVSRRLMLRAGSAVVGIWNEAFDLEGSPAKGSTTVPGVQRVLKPDPSISSSSTAGAQP